MDEEASVVIEPFKRFFIVEGRQIFDFVQTTVLKKLGPLCQITGYNTSVYKIPDTGDYIVVSEDNALDQTGQMTELLSPWLEKAEQTFLFTFQSAYTYNTQDEFDKRCFIRTISNTKIETDVDGIAPMEDCNIVYGISAGGKNANFNSIQTVSKNVICFCFSFNMASYSETTFHMLCSLHGLYESRFVCSITGSEVVYSIKLEM